MIVLIADQRFYRSVRLAPPNALLQRIRSGQPLTERSRELIEAIRRSTPTDPRAGGLDRLRHLLGRLRREMTQLGIRPQLQPAGTTTPGQKRFSVSDQYFLINRGDEDPIDLLLEAQISSTAELIEDLLSRGTTLGNVETYYLSFPLTAVSTLLESVEYSVSSTDS